MTKIDSIAPFIEQGYYTVPINGKRLFRNELGKKQGYSFPNDWQKECSKKQNSTHTPLGGLLTGNLGVIQPNTSVIGEVGSPLHLVAIDCDDTQTYNLFRQLDPTNTAIFESIGKRSKEGELISSCTIIYQHIEDLPTSKRLKGTLDLDWYNGTGMVFLPTESNTTKATWYSEETEDGSTNIYNHDKQLVIIKPMPEVVAQVLKLVLAKDGQVQDKTVATTSQHGRRTKGFLGKLLAGYNFKELTAEQTYLPELSKILTPKEYRLDLFKAQGHIHPRDVGVRHDYLFKIMCTLAGDNTVDRELARDVIMWFNCLLDPPRGQKQMEREIIGQIISGRQLNPNGEPYWQYDEDWESIGSWTAITKKKGDLLDIFYDEASRTYYIYNTQTDEVTPMVKKAQLIEHIQATTIEPFNQKEVIADMNNVDTVVEPTEDFGYLEDDTQFNLFKPTQALRILADPTLHKENYTRPTEFINYMEHFIPNREQRTYLLSLLRRKLTTFDYSPVVPYIIGVPGSGKGILMTILDRIMGSEYVSKEVGGGLFISNFNKGWLENKYFVNLNELAEGLQNKAERQKGIGDLKLYTGSEQFQCIGKGRDSYSAPQRAMFIMTANKNPLPVEDNDRRIYYIGTPNTFDSSPQCLASKSSRDIYYAITTQIEDIAYWLSTEVENASDNDYTTAPLSDDKYRVIFDTAKPSSKVALVVKDPTHYLHLIREVDINVFTKFKHEGKVTRAELVEAVRDIANLDFTDESIDNMVVEAMGHAGKQDAGRNNINKLDRSYYHMDTTLCSIEADDEAEEIRV